MSLKMSKTILAIICTSLVNCGITLFESGTGNESSPYLSSVIFTLSILVFITKNTSLNKITKRFGPFEYIFQALFYMFLLEATLKFCWFPMEKSVMEFPNKCSEAIKYISKILPNRFWFVRNIELLLQTKGSKIALSYFLSFFILLATLQYAQLLDIRIIVKNGYKCFLNDIIQHTFCDSVTCETPIRQIRSRSKR